MFAFHFTIYSLLLVATALLSLSLAGFGFFGSSFRPAKAFGALMLGVTVWSLGYAFELASPEPAELLWWAKLKYVGIEMLPVTWLVFVLRFVRRDDWITRKRITIQSLAPILMLILVLTNEAHRLIWSSLVFQTINGILVKQIEFGAMYWIGTLYIYGCITAGAVLLFRAMRQAPRLYRPQFYALFLAAAAPLIGNAIFVFHWVPLSFLDLGPFSFAITGIALAWAISRANFLNIVPLARNAIIEGMPDGVLVLDTEDRIVDLNPVAARWLGVELNQVVGQPLSRVGVRIDAPREQKASFKLYVPLSPTLEARVLPVLDRDQIPIGRLLMMHEVSEIEQVESELQTTRQMMRVHPSYRGTTEMKRMQFPVEQGITGAVARDGEPRRVADVTQMPEYFNADSQTRSELCVPMRARDQIIGVINAESAQREAFSAEDERLLVTVASQVATTIEKLRLAESERAQAQRQAALLRLSIDLAPSLDETEVCQRGVRALESLGYGNLGLFLLDEATGERVLIAHAGWLGTADGWRIPAGQGVSDRAIREKEINYTPDVTRAPAYVPGLKTGAEVDVPLIAGGRVLGVLIAEKPLPNSFDPADILLLETAANLIAIGIERATLFSAKIQRTMELDRANTLLAALSNVAARLKTATHSEAVMQTLGEELRRLDLNCHFALKDSATGDIVTEYISVDSPALALAEKLTGIKARGFRIKAEQYPHYQQLVVEKKKMYDSDVSENFARTLRRLPKALLRQVARVAGFEAGTPAVNMPLEIDAQDFGILSIWGPRLQEVDLPVFGIFAAQFTSALRNARLFETVQQLAITDAVTGIANRRRLFERGEAEFQRARRFQHPLAAMMIDLDHFKLVNDTYGHAEGDCVLRMFAQLLNENIRAIDTLGRYGGEEFLIILPETALEAARQLAERVRLAVARTDWGACGALTASIGIAAYAPGDSLESLLKRADDAMYRAKEGGRNRVVADS